MFNEHSRIFSESLTRNTILYCIIVHVQDSHNYVKVYYYSRAGWYHAQSNGNL